MNTSISKKRREKDTTQLHFIWVWLYLGVCFVCVVCSIEWKMAMGGVVKLLGTWTSPYAMRPRIALNLKSVQYEFLQDPYGSNRSLLHEYNPVYKKIPVLIHNQRPICESMVIVQYIEDVWPTGPSLFPIDPYDRAIARFWTAYIDDKVRSMCFMDAPFPFLQRGTWLGSGSLIWWASYRSWCFLVSFHLLI